MELCFFVIEAAHIGPGLRVVAGLAAYRSPSGARLGHAPVEFATVGIHVTGSTAKVVEVKRQYFIGTSTRAFFVTITAGNYRVRAIQRESRFAMHRDCKFRTAKIIDRMARFTAVLVRSHHELPVVGILVAVPALRKFHFVNRIRPRGNVALGAFHAGVLAQQRISGSGVLLHSKGAGLPPPFCVTFRALPFARPSFKLALVRIGSVTIHAVCVRHRSLEIGFCVATGAGDGLVLSEQRKVSFGVRKSAKPHVSRPAGRIVAGLATRGEAALVGVRVARRARVERKPYVLNVRHRVGNHCVALVAGDCGMSSRKCEL